MALSEDYSDSEVCSYSFTARFSLPCKHFLHGKIHELRADTQDDKAVFITQRSFADQHRWLAPPRATGEVFEGDKAVFRLLDPLYVRAKGRLKGATIKTLPKAKPSRRQRTEPRDPSLFEHALVSQQPPQPSPEPSNPPATLPVRRFARLF
jgi:hypothetical protein